METKPPSSMRQSPLKSLCHFLVLLLLFMYKLIPQVIPQKALLLTAVTFSMEMNKYNVTFISRS